MSNEDEVRAASAKFYDALNRMANGDSGAMADVWSHGGSATAMHPIGGREVGWEEVEGSFAQVADLSSGGAVELKEQRIEVAGDVAWELGVEKGNITMGGHRAAIDHRVTNIYRREGGAWKLVHHHTDTSPAMLDILAKL